MPSRTPCSSTSPTRWTATAASPSRRSLADSAEARPRAAHDRPPGARGGAAAQEDPAADRRAHRRPDRRRCTRASAAPSSRSCSRSAGRPRTSPATSTARRTRSTSTQDGWHLRPYQQQAVDGFWHGGSGVVVLPCGAGKTLVGAGAMAARQGDDAHPRDQHRSRAAVEGRAAQAHVADRGRDRRVLRRPQGDPAGHHRDLPGADDEAEGRLRPPRPARRPRLGPRRLRRGAPAAGADLPDDRRPAGAPPPRPHRDARARGRPRGRRLQPHRAQALRRAVEGHRGPGLHRPRRLRRGAGHASPTASGWRMP